MKHINIRVQGNVQGVFFRSNAEELAKKLNIVGYVRNEPDGSVYIEAEGKEQDLDQLVSWCHHGPDAADVEKVEVDEGEIQVFNGFEIKYS